MKRTLALLVLFSLPVAAQEPTPTVTIGGQLSDYTCVPRARGVLIPYCYTATPKERQVPAIHRSWLRRHAFELVGDAAIVTVSILDARSSVAAERRCLGCEESNFLLGPRPSHAAIWTLGAGLAAGWVTMNHYVIRWSGDGPERYESSLAVIAPFVAIKTWAAVHNNGLPDTRSCHVSGIC